LNQKFTDDESLEWVKAQYVELLKFVPPENARAVLRIVNQINKHIADHTERIWMEEGERAAIERSVVRPISNN
jgi:hypothetical protein